MRVVGTFTGMGGLETGLRQAGMTPLAFAEIDRHASHVLAAHNPGIPNLGDVSALREFPACDLITAGFPCQDISQAGLMAGIIEGGRSGLVRNVLDAIGRMPRKPEWMLIENVENLLHLHSGSALAWLLNEIEGLGYRWAYRLIDSRAFGLPQRRRRVFILASLTHSPETVLFDGPGLSREPEHDGRAPCGFYWTEGTRGLGFAVDAVPPLKASSKAVNPPAVWRPERSDFVTPTIEDSEALQGFERGWSAPALELKGGRLARWRMVGNAVSVPCSRWIGGRILTGGDVSHDYVELLSGQKWPSSAFGGAGRRFAANVGEWPGHVPYGSISDFLSPDAPFLSLRAALGFRKRFEAGRLRAPDAFRRDIASYAPNLEPNEMAMAA